MHITNYILDRGIFLSPFCEELLEMGLVYKDVRDFLSLLKRENIKLNSVEVHELSPENPIWLGRHYEDIEDMSFYDYFNDMHIKPLFVMDFSENYYDDRLNDFKIRLQKREHDFRPSKIDKFVIKKILDTNNINELRVFRRELSNDKYEAWFSRSEKLKVKNKSDSYIDKSIGARLNGEIEVGFFIHVEEGYIRKIEGYTFYEDWPEEIESVEFFEI